MARLETHPTLRALIVSLGFGLVGCSPASDHSATSQSAPSGPMGSGTPDSATPGAASTARVPTPPARPDPCAEVTLDRASALRMPGLPVVTVKPMPYDWIAWPSVEWLACGKTYPLFTISEPERPKGPLADFAMPEYDDRFLSSVSGAMVTADRKWLFVVQLGKPQYNGGVCPLGLGRVELTAVELATSRARRIETRGKNVGRESLVLAYDGSQLALQWRETCNGAKDKRQFETCALTSNRCESVETAPTALSESPDLLEVTVMGTYAGRPDKVENLGKEDVLARSVRTSEGGAFTAFVTSVPPKRDKENSLPVSRTLWLFDRASGSSRAIASGVSQFEPVWVSDHELVYRPQAEPTPEVEGALAAMRARVPQLEKPSEDPEIAARERSLLAEFVFVERAGKGVPVERLLRFALRKYDARTGEDIELLPGPVAPFGTPRRFDRHHKGRAYEVPD